MKYFWHKLLGMHIIGFTEEGIPLFSLNRIVKNTIINKKIYTELGFICEEFVCPICNMKLLELKG